MNELKSYKMVDEKYCMDCVCVIPSEVYLKTEADKVIAELKAQKAQAEDDCAYWKMREGNAVNAMHETEEACMYLTKSERHQKYKRCLAMAERCKDKIENPVQYDEHDDWLIINEFWERWQDRWLKIAEKFKR